MLDGRLMHDVHLHYFLRPDHWEVADLWAPHWGPGLPQLAFHDRHDWLFDHIENLHESGSHTVCAVNARTGGVAGFVTFDPVIQKLHQIVVASTARGSGAAKMLLDEAKRLCPRGLSVDVEKENARAVRFFEREGFEPKGEAAGAVSMAWAP